MRVAARRVPVLLWAVTLIPITVLGWLGARTLQQDRELEAQRQRERLEVATGRLALEIERRLQGIEEQLAHGAGVQFLPTGIGSRATSPNLFQPIETPVPTVSAASLAAAETEEFQRQDLRTAEGEYGRLASTADTDARSSGTAARRRSKNRSCSPFRTATRWI